MSTYIEIPYSWAQEMDGKESTVTNDRFAFAITVDGRAVTAAQAKDNYPTDFSALEQTGWTIEEIELTQEDFPTPESLIPPGESE